MDGISDRVGEEARLSLSSLTPLSPPLMYRRFKPPLQIYFENEIVYTTYTFQLTNFMIDNEKVNPYNLARISFVFDRSPKGDIFDDIGFYKNI